MIYYITTDGLGSPWVGVELRHMRSLGLPCELWSMRRPAADFFVSDWARDMNARTGLLYPLPLFGMLVSILAAPFLFGSRFFGALLNSLFSERENVRGRLACCFHLLVACHWARTTRHDGVRLIHSHWVHSCGSIGMYTAWLLDIPFSFTGHAADLFRDRVALKDKIRRADFIVCISTYHRDFYRELGADEDKLHVVYCGIDVNEIKPRPDSKTGSRPRVLSFARLADKKGFDVLIDACAILRQRGVDLECHIAGNGPLESELRRQISDLKLEDVVAMSGKALMQEDIPEFLASGDIFAQPCVVAPDGDMDGTPRSLMEAMLCRRPAVSTRVGGIPDIIIDEKSGLLIEQKNPEALADAIQRLIEDKDLASRLAEGGREHILEAFALPKCLDPLVALFRQKLGDSYVPPAENRPGVRHEVDVLVKS